MKSGKTRIGGAFTLIIALFVFTSGCSYFKAKTSNSSQSQHSANKITKEKENTPSYYDFGDVLIPSELKVDKNGSFVFKTPGLSAGVLALKGRVEVNSLISFFKKNMASDNWKIVSSFKSKRTIMLFQKENRWCVISISGFGFYTNVEIWVAPTVNESETGLLR